MSSVLVLQSAAAQAPAWQQRCMGSVQAWAADRGYAYRFLGDELFEQVPDWYLEKVRGRMPIAADLGRLQWIERLLSKGYSWVLWFDADVLIFAPNRLDVTLDQSCVFGQEHWVQAKPKHESNNESRGSVRWAVRKNIHNAFAAFPQSCPVLPFLVDLVLRMMKRVDPDYIAPQMMGPKLLSSLHSLAAFDYVADVGALSPDVLREIATGAGNGALKALCDAQPKPLAAANLCASLVSELLVVEGSARGSAHAQIDRVIDRLLACGDGLAQPGDLGA